MPPHTKSQTGFTIVELLIVIVVIGILSALVTASFSGALAKARDAQRISDINAIKKAIAQYSVDHDGDIIGNGSNCGYQGNGSGFYNLKYGGGSTPSISDCLVTGKYVSSELRDPTASKTINDCVSGNTSCQHYMKQNCTLNGKAYTRIMAHMEDNSKAMTFTNSCGNGFATGYGMNYFVDVF